MGYRTSIIAEKGYLVLEAVLQLTDGDLKRNPCRDGRSEEKADFQTAAGISECRKYVQTSERILCRKADHGCRTSRISGRRCTGIGKNTAVLWINTGDATAEDVTELIRQVAERVKAQSGVTLEPEVKLLGEF